MASISNDPNGRRRIQFIGPNGRRSVRLGKCSERQAEAVKVKVEDFVSAIITGHTPSDSTARWLANLDDALYARLAAVELVKPREAMTLAGFIDAYIASRSDVKPLTATKMKQASRHLMECFDGRRPLRDFTAGDAEDFRLHLIGKGLAENTARRFTGIARQFFRAAIKRGMIVANPFDGLAVAVKGNESRWASVLSGRLKPSRCEWKTWFRRSSPGIRQAMQRPAG